MTLCLFHVACNHDHSVRKLPVDGRPPRFLQRRVGPTRHPSQKHQQGEAGSGDYHVGHQARPDVAPKRAAGVRQAESEGFITLRIIEASL
jgi:hypothetical protein